MPADKIQAENCVQRRPLWCIPCVKLLLAIVIGAVVGWFVVEVFLPVPYPNAAY